MSDYIRPGMRIMDRAEYHQKPKPLTFTEDATVAEAVAAMCERGYGSVIIVDSDDKVTGVVTERDVMQKIVDRDKDAKTTKLADVMTRDPRVARETDEVVDWLRMMSNERFRRLPVVDEHGRIKVVFTQGDFVSYTWPDLMHQAAQMAKATLGRNFTFVMIGGGVAIYTILMIIVLNAFADWN